MSLARLIALIPKHLEYRIVSDDGTWLFRMNGAVVEVRDGAR